MSNPKRTRAEIRDAIKKTKMSKEEVIYEVGDVIETTKGKGKIIFRDKVNGDSPIITLEGQWMYAIEDENGKIIAPIKWYEINQNKYE